MFDFSRTRNIIFDLDGTLIDGYQAITESLNHALGKLGHPSVPVEKVRTLVGTGLENLLAMFVDPEQLADSVVLFRERFKQVCLSGSFLLDGVRPALERLVHAGLHLAVASNKPGDRVREICRHLEIDGYLDVMLGAMDVEQLKPHPQMLLEVLRRLGSAPDDTLYVGDMHLDVETARAAGLRVVCVLTGSSTREQLTAARPDAILNSLDDLIGLLGLS